MYSLHFIAICSKVLIHLATARSLPRTSSVNDLLHSEAETPFSISSRGIGSGVPSIYDPAYAPPAIVALQNIYYQASEWTSTVKLTGPGITLPGRKPHGTSSSILEPLRTKKVAVMLERHCIGCSVLVITSEQAVYAAHFWETSFVADEAWSEEASTRFKKDVLLALMFGGMQQIPPEARNSLRRLHPELTGFTLPFGDATMKPLITRAKTELEFFRAATHPRVTIMTPWHSYKGRGYLAYNTQIRHLQKFVQTLLGLPAESRPQIVGYIQPVKDIRSPNIIPLFSDGKALFQYAPIEDRLLWAPTSRGKCYKQRSKYDMWIEEDHAEEQLFESWTNQLDPNLKEQKDMEDYFDYNPKGPATRDLPAKQAGTNETTGDDAPVCSGPGIRKLQDMPSPEPASIASLIALGLSVPTPVNKGKGKAQPPASTPLRQPTKPTALNKLIKPAG